MALAALEVDYDTQIWTCADPAMRRSLCEARNGSCSITRNLPEDILCMIFKSVKNKCRTYSIGGWVVVTYVCNLWRVCALNDRTIWTEIADDYPLPWTETFLGRAMDAPLSVKLATGPQRGPASQLLYDIIVNSPERLRALLVTSKHWEYAIHRFTKPAPLLEALTLWYHSGSFPPDFLGGRAPPLRIFKANGFRLPSDAFWLSDIRELHLSGRWFPSGAPCNVQTLLVFLQGIPHLEDLTMVVPEMDADICPPTGTMLRTRLRFIDACVFGSSQGFGKLLHYIVTEVLQEFRFGLSDEWAIADVIDFFVSHAVPRPDTLVYMTSGVTTWRLSAEGDTQQRFLEFQPSCSSAAVSILPYLLGLNVKTLKVTARPIAREPIFTLQDSRTVETLRLEGSDNRILTQLLELEASSEASTLPYPSLRRLHLSGVYFGVESETVPKLVQWLAQRKESRLEELIVEDCGLTAESNALLSKTITTILK